MLIRRKVKRGVESREHGANDGLFVKDESREAYAIRLRLMLSEDRVNPREQYFVTIPTVLALHHANP